MEFLYPFFDKETHKIIVDNPLIRKDYPLKNNVIKSDYNLDKDLNVCLVRYGVGFNCEWSIIRIISNNFKGKDFFNKDLYIKTSDLISIEETNKEYLEINNKPDNVINPEAPEIKEETREPFVPYADRKNGLYSVKGEMEYEKFIDNFFIINSIKKAHREGVRILLESRGFRSDSPFIDYLFDNYHVFSYVNKTHDIINTRKCTPVRFTVSIPLVFMDDNYPVIQEVEKNYSSVERELIYSKEELVNNAEKIINSLLARTNQIEELTKPLNFLSNFTLNYEINSITRFVGTFQDLLIKVGRPATRDSIQNYKIGLSKDLEIVYIKIEQKIGNITDLYTVPESVLKQYRFSSDSLFSKRIINYFVNIDKMYLDAYSAQIKILEFLETYVNYPRPQLSKTIKIGEDVRITTEKAREYIDYFNSQQESCSSFTMKELFNTDPVYHLFVTATQQIVMPPDNEKETFDKIKEVIKNIEKDGNKEKGKVASIVWNDFKSGLDSSVSSVTPKGKKIEGFRKGMSIVLHILEDLSLTKIIIQNIVCLLMQGDSSDKEIQDMINKYLTPEILAYVLTLFSNTENWREVLYKIANGAPVDLDIFCIKNKELVYFIKAIMSGKIGTIGNGNNQNTEEFRIFDISKGGINFVNPWKNKIKEIKNLRMTDSSKRNKMYSNMLEEIIVNIVTTLMSRLTSWIQQLIEDSCANDEFNFNLQTENILNSSNTGGGLNLTNNSYDSYKIQNVKNVASITIPLRYEAEPESSVDLLKKLFEDISCVLTPIEVCDALEGNISEETFALIKGIIRRNYLPDLSELQSEQNIYLLFTTLADTVDSNVCKNIKNKINESLSNMTNNLTKDSNTINAFIINCDPVISNARKEILNGKGDTPFLDQKNLKNKKIIEKIKKLNGEELDKPLDLSLFCGTDGEIFPNIDDSFKQHATEVINSFSKKFNVEADIALENYIESSRQNVGDKGVIEYKTIYENLKRNSIFNNPTRISDYTDIIRAVGGLKSEFTKADVENLYKTMLGNGFSLPDPCSIKNVQASEVKTRFLESVPIIVYYNGVTDDEDGERNTTKYMHISDKSLESDELSLDGYLFPENFGSRDKYKFVNIDAGWFSQLRNPSMNFVVLFRYDSFNDGPQGNQITIELGVIQETNDGKKHVKLITPPGTKRKKISDEQKVGEYKFFGESYADNTDDVYDAFHDVFEGKEEFGLVKGMSDSLFYFGSDAYTYFYEINVFNSPNVWGFYGYVPGYLEREGKGDLRSSTTDISEQINIFNFYNINKFKQFLGTSISLDGDNSYGSKVFKEVISTIDNFFNEIPDEFYKTIGEIEIIRQNLLYLIKFNNFPYFQTEMNMKEGYSFKNIGKNTSKINSKIKQRSESIEIEDSLFDIKNSSTRTGYNSPNFESNASTAIGKTSYKYKEIFFDKTIPNNLIIQAETLEELLKNINLNIDIDKINEYGFSYGNIKKYKFNESDRNTIINGFINSSICSYVDSKHGLLLKKDSSLNEFKTDGKNSLFDFNKNSTIETKPESISKETLEFFDNNNRQLLLFRNFNLNLLQTFQEEVCQVFPHYYNSSAWIDDFNKSLKSKLCDGDPAAFPSELTNLILRLIFRTYVGEIMFRGLPKFIYYKDYDISNLLTDVNFKTLIRENFYREIYDLGSGEMISLVQKLAYRYYDELEENTILDNGMAKLDSKYIEKIDIANKKINYFITKEIIYFFAILQKHLKDTIEMNGQYSDFNDFINNLKKQNRYLNICDKLARNIYIQDTFDNTTATIIKLY